MVKVIYKKSAAKTLKKMPLKIRQRMCTELHAIAKDPRHYQGDWKPLQGSELWRLRVGGYRAVCKLQDETIVLLVLKIGARGDVYK